MRVACAAFFVRCWSGARALHFSAAAGASAVRRAKAGDWRAANYFLEHAAVGDALKMDIIQISSMHCRVDLIHALPFL